MHAPHSMRWTGRALALLTCCFGATRAQAQDGPKPEIMLLLDTSARMQWRIDGTEPVGCIETDARPLANMVGTLPRDRAAARENRTRMSLLKEVLAGVPSNPELCLVEDHGWRDGEARGGRGEGHAYGADRITRHFRDLCCESPNGFDGSCSDGALFRPCYNDHGLTPGEAAGEQEALVPGGGMGSGQSTMGFVLAQRTKLRFGLMTSDTSPFGGEGQPPQNPGDAFDQVSFGNEGLTAAVPLLRPVPAQVYGIASGPSGAPAIWPVSSELAISAPNLGIRGADALNGGLIAAHLGMIGHNATTESVTPGAPVPEDNLGPHNDYVRYAIRRLVPLGNTPLSAMLSDAQTHYRDHFAAVLADPEIDPGAQCRQRAIVLFTDGLETPYYGGEQCDLPAGALSQPAAPGCGNGTGTCQMRPQLDAAGQVKTCAQGCDPTIGEACLPADGVNPANGVWCMRPGCEYPAGHPYRAAENLAGELLSEGVEVFVVGLWPTAEGRQRGLRIAAHGSPGRGVAGHDGYFEVNAGTAAASIDQLRAALQTIGARLDSVRTTSSRPLVITPSAADEAGNARTVRQWRIFGYSETPPNDRNYGRIDAIAYGCPDNAQDATVQVLKPNSAFFHTAMATRLPDDPRRSIAIRPSEVVRDPFSAEVEPIAGVVGTPNALFGDTPAIYTPDANQGLWSGIKPHTDFAGIADNVLADATDGRTAPMARMLQGFRGELGLPGGLGAAQPQVGVRSFGGVGRGELAALGPPALGLPDEGYTAFAAAKQNRPTLVAAGADDGQIHVFRANDGYEIFTFVPRRAWNTAHEGQAGVEGPLEMGDMVGCRSLTPGGPATCAASPTADGFRTLLVGGIGAPTGNRGDNFFGVDLTRLAINRQDLVAVQANEFEAAGRGRAWELTGDEVRNSLGDPKIGNTVSRPTLAHARVRGVAGLEPNDAVRAVVIAGCGAEPDGGPFGNRQVPPPEHERVGRCVLVINATDGRLLARLESPEMKWPMVGSPAVFPGVGIAPAERAYIGDAVGNIWRIDLRQPSPAAWTVARAWPPADEPTLIGRPVVDRPAITTGEDGNVVIIYGQGAGAANRVSNVVSFTDRVVPALNAPPTFQAVLNWTIPLRTHERVSGAPLLYDQTVFFTTVNRPAGAVCGNVISRLYGAHFKDVQRDEQGSPAPYTRPAEAGDDGAAVDLSPRPMLPRIADGGGVEAPALSLVLPPGVQVAGLALATTPACVDGEPPSTDLILNVADQSAGAAAVAKDRQRIEFVQGGQLVSAAYDDSIFVDNQGVGMRVCLNCNREGTAQQQGGMRVTPFPSEVVYWGTTFSN